MATRTSDDSVRSATGLAWDAWFDYLNANHASDLSHKEIVALLNGDGGVKSGWWCQSITNEFEKRIGRRETGSTVDAEYQIGVQRTLPVDQSTAWDLVTSPEGTREWLGTEAPMPLEPGDTVVSDDGHTYELRTIKHGERMRLRRTDAETGKESTVQLTLVPAKTGTSVHFHHEGLANGEHREEMREHWRKVAGKILGIV